MKSFVLTPNGVKVRVPGFAEMMAVGVSGWKWARPKWGAEAKEQAMHTLLIENEFGDIEEALAATLDEAALLELDDADACGDKSPESRVDVWVDDDDVA